MQVFSSFSLLQVTTTVVWTRTYEMRRFPSHSGKFTHPRNFPNLLVRSISHPSGQLGQAGNEAPQLQVLIARSDEQASGMSFPQDWQANNAAPQSSRCSQTNFIPLWLDVTAIIRPPHRAHRCFGIVPVSRSTTPYSGPSSNSVTKADGWCIDVMIVTLLRALVRAT